MMTTTVTAIHQNNSFHSLMSSIIKVLKTVQNIDNVGHSRGTL